jgi:hypothetical protein
VVLVVRDAAGRRELLGALVADIRLRRMEVVTVPVDFDRITASGADHGGIQVLGPPPFKT